MLIGYARVSKQCDQVLDLQLDALKSAGIDSDAIYTDHVSGKQSQRPGLDACTKALRAGDQLVIYKLDRLGRDLKHLIGFVDQLTQRKVGLRVLTGQGANIDTSCASGKLVFGIFAALAEFERELIRERTMAGLEAARARGRNGGRPRVFSEDKLIIAQSALKDRRTSVSKLCKEIGVSRQTLYRYLTPDGELR